MHSWATLPVSLHWSSSQTDSQGMFSEAEMAVITKFPLVTIEKWQGSQAPTFLWEEDAWVAAARQIKSARPNTSVVVWMDTMLIYTGWNTSGAAVNHTLNPDAGPFCTTGA
jgi:hypothetical protein